MSFVAALAVGATVNGTDLDADIEFLRGYAQPIPELVAQDLDEIDALVGRQDALAISRLRSYSDTNVARAKYLQGVLMPALKSNELMLAAAMLGYAPAYQALARDHAASGSLVEAAIWAHLAELAGLPMTSGPNGQAVRDGVDDETFNAQLEARVSAIRDHINRHPLAVDALEVKLAANASTDEDDWMRILTTEAE